MKKRTKSYLFPFLLAIAVVGIVFGVILVQSQKTQQTQSKASYNISQECRSQICNRLDENLKRTCVINCSLLQKGTMKCPKLCEPYGPAKELCLEACNTIANPCTVNNGVCAGTRQYGQECISSCRTVQNRDKTCDEAFTDNASWDSIKNQGPAYSTMFKIVVTKCREAFE